MASNATLDFRFVCRTCLVSDADFYKLDAPIITDDADQAERVSLMECLRYCTRLGQAPELPVYICTECSAALQVAYNFIQNAINADQVLRQKLCAGSLHSLAAAEDSWALNSDAKAASRGMTQGASGDGDEGRVMKFRCKICKEKLESKRSLKEHVRLHLDIISYKCEMCQFDSKKRSLLSQHYLEAHGIEAPREHLKPSTAVKRPPPAAKDFQPTSEYFTPVAPPVNALPPMPTTTARTDIDVEEELMKLTSNSEQVRVVGGTNVAIVNGSVITTETNAAAHHQMPLDALTAAGNGLMDAAMLGADADGLCDYADMGVGNQLIVMSDGTVQEVIGNKGVVIEYINAGGDAALGNLQIVQIDGSAVQLNEATALALEGVMGDAMPLATASNTIINMDVDDMIIEETEPEAAAPDTQEEIFVDVEGSNMEVEIPHSVIEMPKVKLIKCKICTENFSSQDKLKTHMLSHNEIPHFFCDQCNFYTFYKIDLTHHYTSQHNIQPTIKQLQPKNKVIENNVKQVYTCDLCLFETHVKANLRRHYLSKHQVEANEVQLRPTMVDDSMDGGDPVPPVVPAKKPKKTPKVDYPTGYSCKKCHKVFYNRDTLQDHFKHDCVADNGQAATAATSSYMHIMEPSGMVDQAVLGGETQHVPVEIMDDGQAQLAAQFVMQSISQPALEETIVTSAAICQPTASGAANEEGGGGAGSINASQLIDFPDDLMPILEETVQTLATPQATEPATTTAPETAATVQESAAGSAIPLDAIPQIVETDNTFDNEIEFDFNGDTFDDEDFDDENDADNDEFKDILLTSDEEMEDASHSPEPEGNQEAGGAGEAVAQQRPVCVQCNKNFYSQYLFENHMFMHRGLAPYRCEMCTNLYNTKRALIRHYRGVHKTIPTRDMVQAKGDKLPTENSTVPETNGATTLMCSKCPFEANDMSNVQIHLSTEHGTNDEKCIIRKLAYECPRCIRSFARKAQLARHLERNHSTVNIIQRPQAAPDAARPEEEAALLGKMANSSNNNNNSISQDAFALVNNNNNHIDHHKTPTGNPAAAENNNRRYNTRKNHAVEQAAGTAITTDLEPSHKPTTITTTAADTRETHTSAHETIASPASTSSSATATATTTTSTTSAEATAQDAPCSGANDSDCGRIAAPDGAVVILTPTSNTTTTKTSPSSMAFSCLTRPEHLVSPPSSSSSRAAAAAATEAATATMCPPTTSSPLMRPDLFSYDYISQAFDETLANMASNGVAQFVPISPTAMQQPQHQQQQIAYKNVSLGLHTRPEGDDDEEDEEDVEQEAAFKCNGCDFVCSTLKELNRHSKGHHVHDSRELFNFECAVCHVRYKTVGHLKVHIKRHVNKEHQCPQCPKAFINDTELKTHLLSHCNEHRYQCDRCDKRFGYAHHLKRHQDIVHHGKRQRCPMYGCERVFTTRSHLKMHMLDHTGQLPYKCKFCSRLFKKRNALRSHTRRNHGVELTDEDIAEIYQKSTGRTNPHDISIVGKRLEAVSPPQAEDPAEALHEREANQ